MTANHPKHFLLVSDFDQTLSFNDSGLVLAELIGAAGFQEKVAGLARSNLVQQGAELAYLIRHDPDFRGIRREHLIEAGRRVRLRRDIPALKAFLDHGVEGHRFSFFVASAATTSWRPAGACASGATSRRWWTSCAAAWRGSSSPSSWPPRRRAR